MAGKHYTDEFKKSVVHLYINGKPIEEIQSEYGISKSTFFGWLKKFREIRISENEVMTAADIAALQKKVATLEEENLILKKAMAIFTKDLRTELPPLDD
jgi:transposase